VGKDLVVPANVSLIGLLPHSPELNPVENLWRLFAGSCG
jgi:transposase